MKNSSSNISPNLLQYIGENKNILKCIQILIDYLRKKVDLIGYRMDQTAKDSTEE